MLIGCPEQLLQQQDSVNINNICWYPQMYFKVVYSLNMEACLAARLDNNTMEYKNLLPAILTETIWILDII